MNGTLSIEKEKNGLILIEFTVERKEDVNRLTLDLIGMGLDALYEPRNVAGRYESCIICNETTGIKMIASQK